MKNLIKKYPYIFLILIAFVAFFIGRSTSSGKKSSHDSGHAGHSDSAASEPTEWTCSMHPQIITPEEGDCPICGMDLIPLDKSGGADEGPREMSMSKSAIALADIQTTEVMRDYPEVQVRMVGTLDYDETREKSLTARFPARIDELYVNYTGIRVKKGEHLAKVYSPDLLTAQRELLTAYKVNPDSVITQAAKDKLRLWDLLPEQIEEIITEGKAKDHFVLKAPIGGVVVSKHVKEGNYLKTGDTLFKIVDLDKLWAFLDAYESDLPWLRFGQEVSFSVEALPGETFEGKVAFIEPEVNRKTRTVSVRVNVSNDNGSLKPGMFVRGIVESSLTEDGQVYAPNLEGKWISPMHPEIIKDEPGSCDICGMDLVPAEDLGYVSNEESQQAPLLIPSSAVLRTGKRAVVYVEKPNKDQPTFEGREITLGPKAGDYFTVAEGIKEGERVVTNGAFKIDSALQILAKPSMMNPEDSQGAEKDQTPTIEIESELAVNLIKPYLALHSALAADDLNQTKEALKALMEISGHSGALADLIHEMLANDSLESIRKPHFEILSNALISNVKNHPDSFPDELMVMHCPMVYNDRGADWLQDSEPLLNPYFGAMMLKCGEIKEKVSNMSKSAKPNEELVLDAEMTQAILPDYLKLQSTLAADDLNVSTETLKSMMDKSGHTGALADLLHTMMAANDLEGIRRPHFETLSNALIKAVKEHPSATSTPLMIMHCPMVYGDTGADWIQDNDKLLNPYFGSSMLRCGYKKEDIK